ncbi:SDR family oxidoreductase [Roseomonas sp. AR75]|uniref:SDR family oxidoreductase n=1 Tax=Roseomonas sp. AR75 TaxID=2562311 RepID=UPI0010C03485|nr:SDR family oxidoreductase [Roseomonas sp. AR75]
MSRNALLVGAAAPLAPALRERLAAEGYDLLAAPHAAAVPALLGRLPEGGHPVAAVILAPALPEGRLDAVAAEDMIAALDEALAEAGMAARALVADRPEAPTARIVIVADWAITGPACETIAAAVSGGLVGLARSWALEFAPLGVTVNAVIAGPEALLADDAVLPLAGPLAARPRPDHVAHAVACFLDPRAAAISGQVLSVCGGRTPGSIPL